MSERKRQGSKPGGVIKIFARLESIKSKSSTR